MLLDGKVAIVSGIGPGMGRDISLLFAREGADLVLGARTEAKVKEVAAEVEELGRRVIPVHLDICDRASCDAAVAAATDAFGRVDVLVNNAFHDGDFTPFEKADLDNWRRTVDTNFFGTLQLTQAVVPIMKEQGDGRIVMVNTMSSVRIQPRFGAYASSKGALATATKTLAMELGGYGIRVNAIHPGYIWGDSVEQYFHHLAERKGITFEEQYESVASETALKYLPHSSEIAGSVLFFASDLSKPVTGQALGVNAGHWFQGF
jgi:NAD(P)-dependent dehydrogenase (short-subunit alcohol dehydrogenase family)